MTLTEIKKLLYTQKPKATFSHIRKGHAYYFTVLTIEVETVDQSHIVMFDIPILDMGDADFFSQMEAKHLIRWIMITEEQPT